MGLERWLKSALTALSEVPCSFPRIYMAAHNCNSQDLTTQTDIQAGKTPTHIK